MIHQIPRFMQKSLAIQMLMCVWLFVIMGSCHESGSQYQRTEPAEVEHIDGSDLSQIKLTEMAERRLGIETTAVSIHPDTEGKLLVPYSAILYDTKGKTWVYVNPESRTYTRHLIEVERIDSNIATLNAGPPPGTVVVTTGAAELLGVEFQTGH